MAKFSKSFRALQSFGVVGLLDESCKIYYNSIFSTRHVGRVSDLLAAQLRRLGAVGDELKLRDLLLVTLYEGCGCQLLSLNAEGEETLPEPLVVECGVDSEKIAVGISFTLPEGFSFDPADLADRNRIEAFITRISSQSDHVIVRTEERTRRLEVVGLLGSIPQTAAQSGKNIEVVALQYDARISPLKAEYIELGDLDYAKLLSEDSPGQLDDRPATGELLSKNAASIEDESEVTVSGKKPHKEKLTRISGVTQHLGSEDNEISVIEDMPEEEVLDHPSEKQLQSAKKQIELYQERITRLQSKIGKFEIQRQNEPIVVRKSSSFKEIIQNIWPFSKPKPEPESVEEPMTEPSGDGRIRIETKDLNVPDASDSLADEILKEQVENLQSTIDRMQRESETMKKELGNGRAKKWAEGMLGELLTEKARLNELSKKLNMTLRQKELEFRNKQLALQEELRRKDDQLKQKAFALERAKEQLSQTSNSLERSRASQTTASAETQFKQKLLFTQKLLAAAKEENLNLSRKFEETRGQLSIAQSASKGKAQKDIELENLRVKYDRLMRQHDEFKHANHQMMERLGEFEKQKSSGNPEELKRKLETAMRLVATHQTDATMLRSKVEEMQKTETRLKVEIQRLSQNLRTLKASALPSGGGGGAGGTGSSDGGGSEAA